MSNSGYIICIAAIVVAIWDGIAVSVFGLYGSESWWFNRVGRAYPSFILCIGLLVGHFFAYMAPPVAQGVMSVFQPKK